jgi:hypothetical protein
LEEEQPKYSLEERGRFFTVLVFLSMMNGFAQVVNGIMSLFAVPTLGPDLEREAEDLEKAAGGILSYESIMEYHQAYFDKFYSINLTNMVLFGGGLVGLFYMYRLQRKGFFLYGFCHILICFVPVILVLNNNFSLIMAFSQLLLAAAFIAMYASQLKRMKY